MLCSCTHSLAHTQTRARACTRTARRRRRLAQPPPSSKRRRRAQPIRRCSYGRARSPHAHRSAPGQTTSTKTRVSRYVCVCRNGHSNKRQPIPSVVFAPAKRATSTIRIVCASTPTLVRPHTHTDTPAHRHTDAHTHTRTLSRSLLLACGRVSTYVRPYIYAANGH